MVPATHRLSRWLRVNDGGLAPGVPFDTLRARGYINPRARAVADGPDFPRAIRAGVPGIADGGPVR